MDSHPQAPQQLRQALEQSPNPVLSAPLQTRKISQSGSHKTEKEKMILMEPFQPYDEQLMIERDQCKGALYFFNNTVYLAVAIARDDRRRHFERIIKAAWILPRHRYHPSGVNGGHVGGNVHVATPFYCEYGYNFSIGDNVSIGSCCQFRDAAMIAIGKNTKIGSCVTISTLETLTDTKSLKGSNGTEIARKVSIGVNVYIGDKVTIEAGVNIGDNVIVRSGSVIVHVSTAEVMYDCVR
jgi:acetyltransferase-like isoleucine patch superfamily enzyme